MRTKTTANFGTSLRWMTGASVLLGQLLSGAAAGADGERGFYAGLQVGTSFVDSEKLVPRLQPESEPFRKAIASHFEDDDTNWGGVVGWGFSPHVGIELSYLDLGEFAGVYDSCLPPLVCILSFPTERTVETRAATVQTVLWSPWLRDSRLSLGAKAGLAYFDTNLVEETSVAVSGGVPSMSSSSESGVDVAYGLLARVRTTSRSSARIAWDRLPYRIPSAIEGLGPSAVFYVDVITVGYIFKLG